jgi:hypothetical protein
MTRKGEGPYIAYSDKVSINANGVVALQLPSNGRDVKNLMIGHFERPLEVYVQDMNVLNEGELASAFDYADVDPHLFGFSRLKRTPATAALVASVDRDSFSEFDFSVRKEPKEWIYTVEYSRVSCASANPDRYTWTFDVRAASLSAEVVEYESTHSLTRFFIHLLEFVSVSFGFSIYTLMVLPSNM